MPALSEDSAPSGARIDAGSRDLFPLHVGDSWTYDFVRNGSVERAITRSVTASRGGGVFVLSENGRADPADNGDEFRRLDADGLRLFDPFGAQGVFPGLYSALPALLEFPTPMYPVDGLPAGRSGRFGARGCALQHEISVLVQAPIDGTRITVTFSEG